MVGRASLASAIYECWLWWSFLDEFCYRHPLLPPYSIFSSPSNCIINRESKSPFDIPIRQYWSSNIKNDNFLSFLSGRNVMANKSKARISSLSISEQIWLDSSICCCPNANFWQPSSITLGLSKYKPWKFATDVFAGELLYNELIVWVGRNFSRRPSN
jgi:hypothetical protein